VVVPLLAEYEYQGVDAYQGIPVYHIRAKYASRYQAGYSGGQRNSGAGFSRLQGTHDVDILVRISDGLPLLMRDVMDETYTWPDGKTVRFRGFTLNFGESGVPFNRDSIIASISGSLGVQAQGPGGGLAGSPGNGLDAGRDRVSHGGISGDGENGDRFGHGVEDSGAAVIQESREEELTNRYGGLEDLAVVTTDNGEENGADLGIDLYSVPEGIRLSVRDVRFRADSDEILPAEQYRLDMIAQILLKIPDRFFLVEGHTAAIGRAAGEMELSILRAKRIVDELTGRGIAAERFIYKGWGGTKPIGDNATESGRQLNRRVEITILE
jgi:outer membrane protein OmpA-like peptidoglycan-associated protein